MSTPTRSSLVSAIKLCTARKSLSEGKPFHAYVIKHGFLPETRLYNHLLNMYSKSSSFISARKLFNEMPERNLVSFSTLISGYSQSGKPQCALHLVPHLCRQGLAINQFVFSSLILACSKLRWIDQGKQIHAQVLVSDFGSDPFVGASLVDMYSKFGDLDSAVVVFGSSTIPDSVTYNSMISGFVNFCSYEKALELFAEALRDTDLKPTEFTFGSMIKACSNLYRDLGEQIHSFIMKTGFEADIFVGTSLVDMYGKFGDMESSKHVFQHVKYVDLALYNSMIVGLSNNNLSNAAMELFSQLRLEGFYPNECTFSSILKACGSLKCLNFGKIIHALIVKSEFGTDLIVLTALINMYMKCDYAKDSYKTFDMLSERSTVLYNAMISGLGQCGDYEGALNLYIGMNQENVIPNHATFVSLMNLCVAHEKAVYVHAIKHGFEHDLMVHNAFLDSLIRGGYIEEARWLFNHMQDRDVVSWTCIISGLSELSLEHEAVQLFKEMKSSGVPPNGFTFSSVLKACGSLADLEKGTWIHGCSIKHGVINEAFTDASLIDMYARCGSLEECYKLFDEMPKRNVVLWNTMITACSQHGKGYEALELFHRMEMYDIEPTHVSFTSLLSACSRCGLVEEGVHIFESITRKHNMVPSIEHYACMVDMFGRARMLERAKELIDGMPYKPNPSIWKTFLASCKLHGKLGLAQVACDKVLGMEGGGDNTSLVLLSNIYSEFGKWDDVERVRGSRDCGKNDTGLSWMQIKRG